MPTWTNIHHIFFIYAMKTVVSSFTILDFRSVISTILPRANAILNFCEVICADLPRGAHYTFTFWNKSKCLRISSVRTLVFHTLNTIITFSTWPVSSDCRGFQFTDVSIFANKILKLVIYHANVRTIVFLWTRTAFSCAFKNFIYFSVVVCSYWASFYLCISWMFIAVTTFRTLKRFYTTTVLLHQTIVACWTTSTILLHRFVCESSKRTFHHHICWIWTVETFLTFMLTKIVTIESRFTFWNYVKRSTYWTVWVDRTR